MLFVEDEPLLAEAICVLLVEAEGIPVGPAATVGEARQLIRQERSLNAAVLDVNLGDGPSTPVFEALSGRGVPTVICTGGGHPGGRTPAPHEPLVALSKPVLLGRLIGELRKVIAFTGLGSQSKGGLPALGPAADVLASRVAFHNSGSAGHDAVSR